MKEPDLRVGLFAILIRKPLSVDGCIATRAITNVPVVDSPPIRKP